jgi:hypothetical protein
LILDFDINSAKQSAFEDWKIDREREKIEKGDKEEDTEHKIIEDDNESDDENKVKSNKKTDKLEGIRE